MVINNEWSRRPLPQRHSDGPPAPMRSTLLLLLSASLPAASETVPIERVEIERFLSASGSFNILELPPILTSESGLRTKYRALALRVHPDEHCNDPTSRRCADANEAFLKVQHAYER